MLAKLIMGRRSHSCQHVQLEEGICDLQHQDVWVIVLMTDENALTSAAHAMMFVVFL